MTWAWTGGAAEVFDNITHQITHDGKTGNQRPPESEKISEKVKVRRRKNSTQNMRELSSTHEITHNRSSTHEKRGYGKPVTP